MNGLTGLCSNPSAAKSIRPATQKTSGKYVCARVGLCFFRGRMISAVCFGRSRSVAAGALWLLATLACPAWDYDQHRLVNQMALASLPTNFPAFVQAAETRERIAFLAGEPDRWRNTPDYVLRHENGPDHYLDLEDLAEHHLKASELSPFRYEFTAQLAQARRAHADHFPPVDAAKDQDHTRSLIGFLPWTVAEQYSKLKAQFSYLRVFEELGTPEEIANGRQNCVYIMGVMGHYVGDSTQPLHTTKHFNGWVGANPAGYTTNHGIHALMDGGFLRQVPVRREALLARLRPARAVRELPVGGAGANADLFAEVLAFVQTQNRLVEPLYQMEKAGKFRSEQPGAQEGRAFLEQQLLAAGQMLGDLWLTAWQQAHGDKFLRDALVRRAGGAKGQ